jgi:hypothetical protein
MTRNEEVVDELASQLERLGIDITTEAGRSEFRDDMRWAKQNRKRCEKVFGATVLVIIGGTATLLGNWLLTGAGAYFKGSGGQ